MLSRKKITELSRSCRMKYVSVGNINAPMSVKSDIIMMDGRNIKRLRIILWTVGCKVASCTMCPFPAESSQAVTDDNLINQFNNSIGDVDINQYDMVTIFCNGNFFSDHEISDNVRRYIFTKLSYFDIEYITVESLPQFLTNEKIFAAKEILGDIKLQVFMGLQTSNDFVRRYAVNSTCERSSFERVVNTMHLVGFIPAAFVIIKSPFLTENEGVTDTLRTLYYLDALNVTHVTLCPMRIADNTLLKKIMSFGYYRPLWLWSVVRILSIYHRTSNHATVMVNTSELKDLINLDSVCAMHRCKDDNCGNSLIEKIEKYLFNRNLGELEFDCECRKEYLNNLREEENMFKFDVEKRITKFMSEYEEYGK